jgi:hypothetical protein
MGTPLLANPIENQRSSDSLCVVSATVRIRGSAKIDVAALSVVSEVTIPGDGSWARQAFGPA